MSSLSECTSYKYEYYGDDILKRLQQFYHQGELFDMVLVADIDDVRVPIHRIMLPATSDYFLGMFRSTLKEANTNELRLKNVDGPLLKLLVDYMYTGSIQLRNETVEAVLKAADFFQMELLLKICCAFLKKNLDPSNCLGITLLAEQHNYKDLHEKATDYVYEHFDEVCSEGEYLLLSEEQLRQFLASDGLAIVSQRNLFHSIVAWVKHDKATREQLLVSLLSYVRFTLLDPKFIYECSQKAVSGTEEYQKLICSWLQWHSLHERGGLPDTTEAHNAKLHFLSVRMAFEVEVQSFNPRTNKWSYVARTRHSTTSNHVDGTIVNNKFVIGVGSSFKVEYLDLQTMKWSNLPALGIERYAPTFIVLNKDLYAVGGNWNTGSLCVGVEKYDFSTSKWKRLSSLPVYMDGITAVALDGLLYAVCPDHPYLECYNPSSNTWTHKRAKNEKSVGFGLAAVNGYLYAVGGIYNGVVSKTVERYDPSKNTWTAVKPLNVGRSRIKCTSHNNRLIAAGGNTGKREEYVEEYNPETDEWKTLPPLLPYYEVFYLPFSM